MPRHRSDTFVTARLPNPPPLRRSDTFATALLFDPLCRHRSDTFDWPDPIFRLCSVPFRYRSATFASFRNIPLTVMPPR
ncbi:hypothetical protein chiPu_0002275 [Chiloscyllium punctatum]|uniref:Uncharacterized protein n=1 Tax=Chiloscyllium punctatum TaxID=137246 RepID=A0A401S0G4_CHIPU|nr:hypothetical protein [Chiloscyllium punctatum]